MIYNWITFNKINEESQRGQKKWNGIDVDECQPIEMEPASRNVCAIKMWWFTRKHTHALTNWACCTIFVPVSRLTDRIDLMRLLFTFLYFMVKFKTISVQRTNAEHNTIEFAKEAKRYSTFYLFFSSRRLLNGTSHRRRQQRQQQQRQQRPR